MSRWIYVWTVEPSVWTSVVSYRNSWSEHLCVWTYMCSLYVEIAGTFSSFEKIRFLGSGWILKSELIMMNEMGCKVICSCMQDMLELISFLFMMFCVSGTLVIETLWKLFTIWNYDQKNHSEMMNLVGGEMGSWSYISPEISLDTGFWLVGSYSIVNSIVIKTKIYGGELKDIRFIIKLPKKLQAQSCLLASFPVEYSPNIMKILSWAY